MNLLAQSKSYLSETLAFLHKIQGPQRVVIIYARTKQRALELAAESELCTQRQLVYLGEENDNS